MTSDLHVLTGAYAAGALSEAERVSFEEHLRSCGHCRQEVRELAETASLLGIAAAEAAPPALRERVMAEIGATRQLPPRLAQLAEHADRRRAARGRRWSLTAAACLAVFTIGLGGYAVQLQEENSDLRAASEQIAAVQTAADARTLTDSGGGAVASLTMSRANNEMVFQSQGLAELAADRTYQLWLLGAEGPRSVGMFTPAEGRHAPRLISGPGQASTLAVTEERKGGSDRPTTPPIISIALPKEA